MKMKGSIHGIFRGSVLFSNIEKIKLETVRECGDGMEFELE